MKSGGKRVEKREKQVRTRVGIGAKRNGGRVGRRGVEKNGTTLNELGSMGSHPCKKSWRTCGFKKLNYIVDVIFPAK